MDARTPPKEVRIVIASRMWDRYDEFFAALVAQEGVEIITARTGMATLELAKLRSPTLVLIDEGLPDFSPMQLAVELMRVNAFIYTAIISPLPEDAFHELSEGLGVLAQVSPDPGAADARKLLEQINAVS